MEKILYTALFAFVLSFGMLIMPPAPKDGLRSISAEKIVQDSAQVIYKTYCSGCHGEKMEAFVDRRWLHGNTRKDLLNTITKGYPEKGMPSFGNTFTAAQIESLADYILGGIAQVKQYGFSEKNAPTQSSFTSEDGFAYRLDTVASGLDIPWGMAFLPDGEMLISDRDGPLYRKDAQGKLHQISGVPKVVAQGQGGLLDVELHPKFSENKWIYLSYSKPENASGKKATTAIMRARLQGDQLEDQKIIFEAKPYFSTKHHYGSRLEFDREGYLYFSVGDRGKRDINPQNLDNHCGKIHRLNDDGSIPEDNPFVATKGALPSIYSFGHRNPQGVAMNPADGSIWTHEHGPRGGDEINIIQKSKNYGWPVISYGINYNGTIFTSKTEEEGMEQPLIYWLPSIAPCGMTFVKGDRYPAWKGHLLVGSLRFKYLNLCKVENNKVAKQEFLVQNIGRVRNVEMGNDNYIYVAVENPGYIFRLMPVE